jgi:hypothetical protein
MRCVGGVVVAAAVAVVLCVTPAVAEQPTAGMDTPRFLLFSSGDIWNHGGFLHGGLVWSPRGIDNDGFALKAMFGGGAYRYVSGALGNARVTGRMLTASILPGWRFVRGKFIATIFAGLDLQDHRLSPDDPSASLRGSYAGFRINAELWYEPTTFTMAAADGSISTIDASYNARVAFGWKAFQRYYIGPEVQGFAAGDNYRQLRAGVHITGLRTAMVEWNGGLGWAYDSDDRDGLYARIGVLMRR